MVFGPTQGCVRDPFTRLRPPIGIELRKEIFEAAVEKLKGKEKK